MLHTGNPTRFELWSCAVIVVAVFVALSFRRDSPTDSQTTEILRRQLDCLIMIEAKLGKMTVTASGNSVPIDRPRTREDNIRDVLKKQGNIE